MIKALALDDERPALEIIDAFCERIPGVDLRRTFTSTREARHYLEGNPVDLLFLDINMPAESGMSFFRSLSQNCLVIFTTAHATYAVESYELRAIDYLLKPFTFERFQEAVQKATDRLKYQQQTTDPQQSYLLLRVDYSLVKVPTADIEFIEGLDNYLKIHLLNQKPLVVRLTMKAILELLPAQGFVRVHRSFIIALDKIQSVRNKLITVGDEEIPLGSSYEEGFFRRFQG